MAKFFYVRCEKCPRRQQPTFTLFYSCPFRNLITNHKTPAITFIHSPRHQVQHRELLNFAVAAPINSSACHLCFCWPSHSHSVPNIRHHHAWYLPKEFSTSIWWPFQTPLPTPPISACSPIADLGKTSLPRAPKKAVERGRAPERKNWNVRRVVVPANIPVIRNYPMLSDFFRKLTREFHRRGIYFCTAIRTAFSPSCHSTTPAWMHYSRNSISDILYSSVLPQGESVLCRIAREIQFDDD